MKHHDHRRILHVEDEIFVPIGDDMQSPTLSESLAKAARQQMDDVAASAYHLERARLPADPRRGKRRYGNTA